MLFLKDILSLENNVQWGTFSSDISCMLISLLLQVNSVKTPNLQYQPEFFGATVDTAHRHQRRSLIPSSLCCTVRYTIRLLDSSYWTWSSFQCCVCASRHCTTMYARRMHLPRSIHTARIHKYTHSASALSSGHELSKEASLHWVSALHENILEFNWIYGRVHTSALSKGLHCKPSFWPFWTYRPSHCPLPIHHPGPVWATISDLSIFPSPSSSPHVGEIFFKKHLDQFRRVIGQLRTWGQLRPCKTTVHRCVGVQTQSERSEVCKKCWCYSRRVTSFSLSVG